MRPIQEVRSEGPQGPAYIRFSNEPVARTEPAEFDDDLIVDYDAAGSVVGVELVTIGHGVLNALIEVARLNDLDLAALLTSRTFPSSSAA
jgi:uncharacterized protein YuzE